MKYSIKHQKCSHDAFLPQFTPSQFIISDSPFLINSISQILLKKRRGSASLFLDLREDIL